MHELSIAMNIADLAQKQAELAGAKKVRGIELDIGCFSGVDPDALRFALDLAFRDSLLEETEIKMNRIEACCRCLDCDHEFEATGFQLTCPKCLGSHTRLSSGMEMQIRSLLIEE